MKNKKAKPKQAEKEVNPNWSALNLLDRTLKSRKKIEAELNKRNTSKH